MTYAATTYSGQTYAGATQSQESAIDTISFNGY